MSDLPVDDGLWCRRYRPSPAATARLVCLPHAGGAAPFFLPFAAALSPDVDVISVQYPGRQDRRSEQPLTDVNALVDQIHDALVRQPPLPVTFLGHSLGSLVGFEIVRRLEDGGSPATHLFASGRGGPSIHREGAVHQRDDEGILFAVQYLNGTAAPVLANEQLMRAALPALRADYQAAETYRCAPDVTVTCPITVLNGDADPETTPSEARAWERHTTGTCTLRTFSGGHFFITNHTDEVIGLLREHFVATSDDNRRPTPHP